LSSAADATRWNWETGGVVFVADDLAGWLTGLLADAGRKKLTRLVLGTDQERVLRSAATAAVQRTAAELRPGDDEQAGQLAMVLSEVFGEPVPGAQLAGHATVLEALQAGIAGQIAVLDDAGLTGTGESSADVLEVPGTVLAAKLTGHLLREIVVRGARGGPLFPLASQLNDDVTHLQGQRLEDIVGRLASDLRAVLTRLDRQAVRQSAAVMARPDEVAGHVFISYVREDSRRVDQLQEMLEAAGVRVWRDTADLWPGEDWRAKIRHAITDNAFVFIACFSYKSLARKISYQNEELTLAIEQLRLRRPGEPWLIPVRFDDCDIPDIEIGGGRTLTWLQRVDLFGDCSDEGAERLAATVLRILRRQSDAEKDEADRQCQEAFTSDTMFSIDQAHKITGVPSRRIQSWLNKNWLGTTDTRSEVQFSVRTLIIAAVLNQWYIKKLFCSGQIPGDFEQPRCWVSLLRHSRRHRTLRRSIYSRREPGSGSNRAHRSEQRYLTRTTRDSLRPKRFAPRYLSRDS
jgi:hypothetical protein